jgi:hypothetical protein
MQAPLGKSVNELLGQKHPELHADQLKEGENVLLKEKDGTKYMAMVFEGKIDRLAVFDAKGKQGTTVRIEPPPPAKPAEFLNFALVCMCVPQSNEIGGEGARCWWVRLPDD